MLELKTMNWRGLVMEKSHEYGSGRIYLGSLQRIDFEDLFLK